MQCCVFLSSESGSMLGLLVLHFVSIVDVCVRRMVWMLSDQKNLLISGSFETSKIAFPFLCGSCMDLNVRSECCQPIFL